MTTITICDDYEGRVTVEGATDSTWTDTLKLFFRALRGLGYIIEFDCSDEEIVDMVREKSRKFYYEDGYT